MANNNGESVFSNIAKLLEYGKGTNPQDLGKASQNQSSQGSGNINNVIETVKGTQPWVDIANAAKVEPQEVQLLIAELGEGGDEIVKVLAPEKLNEAVVRYVRN